MQSLDQAACTCPPGMSGVAAGPSGETTTTLSPLCTDMDECALGVHTCEQRCVNTVGSFDCSCEAGYVRRGAGACVERSVSPLPLVVCICAALVIFMIAMSA